MIYKVDTIVQFKHTYFIECKEESHALDTITMQEAEEADQEYLGEVIFSSEPVTELDFSDFMHGKDNEYMGRDNIYKVDYGN